MDAIEQLCRKLARLPGLGPRSARRVALALLEEPEERLQPLIAALQLAAQQVNLCSECGNLDDTQPCRICQSPRRIPEMLCVIERVADLWALERAGGYQGLYHVLGGTLSPIDGRGPAQLRMQSLVTRVQKNRVIEVILATPMTVEGQVTAQYVVDLVTPHRVRITRLAQGVPMGGEFDYLDDATLKAALNARREF